MVLSLCIVGIITAIDQFTKFLFYGMPAKSIIGNLLWFQSTLNTGGGFSIFENLTWLLTIISFIAVIVFLFLIINKKYIKDNNLKIILGFICGGTLGNLIDRLIFGGVRDFIYLKFINFAIFNIADMAITFGAIALCVYILIIELKKSKSSQSEKNLQEIKETSLDTAENNKKEEE